MSYSVEKLDNSQVKFNFTVDAETFEKACQQAYQKEKGKYNVPGFRKGHAPRKVIEGTYGPVFNEPAIDIVINDSYGEVFQKEKDFEPVAQPELADLDFKDDGSLVFAIQVTVKPEVKLGKYTGLNIARTVKKVAAKDVDEALKQKQEQQARLVDVDRAAKNGDIVNIDFVGSVDGKVFDGGSSEKFDLELGSGQFIPGFEDQLVGTKAGDKKDVKVTFPEDYQAEELKAKEAVFACTVNGVKVKELPALDDEFAKDISEFDTLKEYKADLKKNLQSQAENQADRDFEAKVIEKVVDNAKVEIPAVMVSEECDAMLSEFEYRLQYQGMKMDDYLKYTKLTRDQVKDQYKEQAEKSVKLRLVMEAIVKKEDIKFDDKDMDAQIEKMATQSGQSVEDFKKTMTKDHIDYIVNTVLSGKIMDFLKDKNLKAAKEEKAEEKAEVKEESPKKAPAKKACAKKKTEKAE